MGAGYVAEVITLFLWIMHKPQLPKQAQARSSSVPPVWEGILPPLPINEPRRLEGFAPVRHSGNAGRAGLRPHDPAVVPPPGLSNLADQSAGRDAAMVQVPPRPGCAL